MTTTPTNYLVVQSLGYAGKHNKLRIEGIYTDRTKAYHHMMSAGGKLVMIATDEQHYTVGDVFFGDLLLRLIATKDPSVTTYRRKS